MFDFLSQKLSTIFSGFGSKTLTEKSIEQTLISVHDALLEADVPYEIVQTFVEDIKKEILGQKVLKSLKPAEQIMKVVHDRLLTFLGGKSIDAQFSFQIPSTIMMLGLQGSGKTTTIGKLARFMLESAEKRGKKRRILVGSVDFYRPAAREQLQIVAQIAGVDYYQAQSQNPVMAAQEIYNYSQKNQYELLFLDTAGRLHTDQTMLDELRALDKTIKPTYKLLVLDAMTGQESLRIAQNFDKEIGFSSAILTKMDSNARGGAAFAFKAIIKKPILFVGIGEKNGDLEPFRPERIAQRLLGMGDMMSLVEKAQATIKHQEQQKMEAAFKQGHFTLQDFASQIDMVNKLGSLTQLMKYLPGAQQFNVSSQQLEQGETEIKRFKAIISSMTLKERLYPKILDTSRKQRIARGAGVEVTDVNRLLTKFEESMQFVKLFKKMGGQNPLFK